MKLQYILQLQKQYLNLKQAYNNAFTPLYWSKVNSHLSTTCVWAHVYVLGETRDTSSHPHTPLYTFPLKRYINDKLSLFTNVHFDLEQKYVHNRH